MHQISAFQLILVTYLWQAASTRNDVLDLGTDLVYYLRNPDIKETLTIKQTQLRQHGFLTKMFIKPAQHKDLSNMRSNIPSNLKSAEVHYRLIKKFPDCNQNKLLGSIIHLNNSIPLLIFDEDTVTKVGRRLSRKLRRFVKFHSSDINGHPTCDLEYRILHHRDIYARLDDTVKEMTEFRFVIRVLDPTRGRGRGRRRLDKPAEKFTTPTLEPTTDSNPDLS